MSFRDDRLAVNQETFRSAKFILPGHPRIEGEEIVSENGRYEVVSKAP